MKTSILFILISCNLFAQVGINTPNPQDIFHVDGARDNPANGIPNAAQQANDLILSSTGNLGLGTTIPANKFHVVANTTSAGRFTLIDALQGTVDAPTLVLRNISPVATGNRTFLGFNNTGPTTGGANWGIGSIRTTTTEDFYMGNSLGATYIERFRITAAGNVGIGTNAPTAKLEISSGANGTSGLKFTNMNSASTPVANAAGLAVDATGNVVVEAIIQKARFKGSISTVSLPANNSSQTGPFTMLSYTESIDIGNNFVTNTFTAPRTGYYIVSANIVLVPSVDWNTSSNELYFDALVNGALTLANTNVFSVSTSTSVEGPSVSINGLVSMNAGQQLTIRGWMFNNNIARTIQTGRTFLSISEL
jgi:hypothetical protein